MKQYRSVALVIGTLILSACGNSPSPSEDPFDGGPSIDAGADSDAGSISDAGSGEPTVIDGPSSRLSCSDACAAVGRTCDDTHVWVAGLPGGGGYFDYGGGCQSIAICSVAPTATKMCLNQVHDLSSYRCACQ